MFVPCENNVKEYIGNSSFVKSELFNKFVSNL